MISVENGRIVVRGDENEIAHDIVRLKYQIFLKNAGYETIFLSADVVAKEEAVIRRRVLKEVKKKRI